MEKATVNKIMTLSFLLAAALVYWVTKVLMSTAAGSFPMASRLYAMEIFQHGLPLSLAVITFCILQFKKSIRVWAEEVINEVAKVVWPSRKDTVAMTISVTIMLLISGVVLAVFDWASGEVINLILG